MSDYQFNLPDIGEGLGEGEVVRWLVEPGAVVRADQIMVEVETDKAVVEIPAPVSGVLKTIGGGPGDVIAVGKLLAVIETEAGKTRRRTEAAAAPPKPPEESSESKQPRATAPARSNHRLPHLPDRRR